jgi:AraC-like DNA-binding protein
MDTLHSQPASLNLRPFVRAGAQREELDLPGPASAPVPGRLEQMREFQFRKLFQVAGTTRRENVGPVTLAGSSLDALRAGIGRLHQQLAVVRSSPVRVAVAERFLHVQAARSSAGNDDLARDAASRIFRASGLVRIPDLAAHYGLSLRQFERRFKHGVGIAPKSFSRVARFQAALDTKLLTPHRSWLIIAHDLGYHDQMHMIHDFHELAGAAPTEILAKIRDARPPAMQNVSRL